MNRDDIKELHYWAGQAETVINKIVDANNPPSVRDLMQAYTAVQEVMGIATSTYHDEFDKIGENQ